MLVNLSILLLWIPSLLGWGLSLRVFLGSGIKADRSRDYLNPGVIVILGFVPLAILATFLHFFFAISPGISLSVLGVGYLLLILERRTVVTHFTKAGMAGVVPIMAAVSLFASKPLVHFDTGLYHIQSLKWCTTYPLVRGLANLHERLAFTSVWTPLSAILDYPRLPGSTSFPVTCLLLVGFGWAAGVAILNIQDDRRSVDEIFLAASGCFWIWMLISDSDFVILPSLSTDAPIYLLTLLVTHLLLRFCSRRDWRDLFQAVAFSALAVTSKMSAAPLLGFLLFFCAFTWVRRKDQGSREGSMWLPLGIVISLLIGLWIARSVYLSGYLIFPITSTALTFLPWHLPVPMAEQLVSTLKAWARLPEVSPDIVLTNSFWLRHYFSRFNEEIVYPIIAYSLVGGMLLIHVVRLTGVAGDALLKSAPAAGMLILGTAFWFMTAPDPRYGYGYLFALACLTFSIGVASLPRAQSGLIRTLLAWAALIPLITVGDFSRFQLLDLPRLGSGPNLVDKTIQGIPIYVAVGDQRILDGPLPSTPYFRGSLWTKRDSNGRILEFDLAKAVDVPYYGTIPLAVRNGGR